MILDPLAIAVTAADSFFRDNSDADQGWWELKIWSTISVPGLLITGSKSTMYVHKAQMVAA